MKAPTQGLVWVALPTTFELEGLLHSQEGTITEPLADSKVKLYQEAVHNLLCISAERAERICRADICAAAKHAPDENEPGKSHQA